MTLYDYLRKMPEETEVAVHDDNYDTETYFYAYFTPEHGDLWTKSMIELSKKLTVTEIGTSGVCVNLSAVIEKNIVALSSAELFIHCTTDSIMDDIDNILAGNVSEQWFEKFVSVFK